MWLEPATGQRAPPASSSLTVQTILAHIMPSISSAAMPFRRVRSHELHKHLQVEEKEQPWVSRWRDKYLGAASPIHRSEVLVRTHEAGRCPRLPQRVQPNFNVRFVKFG